MFMGVIEREVAWKSVNIFSIISTNLVAKSIGGGSRDKEGEVDVLEE